MTTRRLDPVAVLYRLARVAASTLLRLAFDACRSGDDEPSRSGGSSPDVTLTVDVLSPTEVHLSWTDPSTRYAQTPRDLYSEVDRDGANLTTTHQFDYTDIAVTTGTQYCYQIF